MFLQNIEAGATLKLYVSITLLNFIIICFTRKRLDLCLDKFNQVRYNDTVKVGLLAQRLEQLAHNQLVVGSNPSEPKGYL